MSSYTVIYIRHIRAAKMCSHGARSFFKRHDLDWNSFLKNGITVGEIEHIAEKDAMCRRVVEVALGQQ